MDREHLATVKADLLKQLAEIEAEEKKIHEEELILRKKLAKEKWDFIINNTKFLLDNLFPNHSRSSCSDTDHWNGWDYSRQKAECTRCFILDLLEDELLREDFDVKFDVEITRMS